MWIYKAGTAGGRRDYPFATSPFFEEASPARGGREGRRRWAFLASQQRTSASGQRRPGWDGAAAGSRSRLTFGQRPLICAHGLLRRLRPGHLCPEPRGLGGTTFCLAAECPPGPAIPELCGLPRAAARLGWPPLLSSPRASCSYKLSKLKMLLRVGDKRER